MLNGTISAKNLNKTDLLILSAVKMKNPSAKKDVIKAITVQKNIENTLPLKAPTTPPSIELILPTNLFENSLSTRPATTLTMKNSTDIKITEYSKPKIFTAIGLIISCPLHRLAYQPKYFRQSLQNQTPQKLDFLL